MKSRNTKVSVPEKKIDLKAQAEDHAILWKSQMETALHSFEKNLIKLDDCAQNLSMSTRSTRFITRLLLKALTRRRRFLVAEISTLTAMICSFEDFIDSLQRDSLSDGLFIFEGLRQSFASDAEKSCNDLAMQRLYASRIKDAQNMKYLVHALLSPPRDGIIRHIK